MEMFARDQMQLHACTWPSWRCFLVIKSNCMLARDQAGDFLLVILCNSMVACDQAGDVCL